MTLQFERGTEQAPVGHALIYFRTDTGSLVATYVSVPPIRFDLSSYMPGFLATAMQGMDLGDGMVAAPMPPIPEEVEGLPYLQALAGRRQDDLVFAGSVSRADVMRLAGETAEAARAYGELYAAVSDLPSSEAEAARVEPDPFESMTQQEQINTLTTLTGRLLDSLQAGAADIEVERQMRQLAETLPAKYRVEEMIQAIHRPGDGARRLAELYIERCYKLYNEEYLDLERIDREIEATHG